MLVILCMIFTFSLAYADDYDLAPMLGGIIKQNLTGEFKVKMENFANTALDEYNKKSNAQFRQGLVRVKEAKTQVVAGVMYYIAFYSGMTVCKNGGNTALKNCQLAKGGDAENSYLICNVEIWEKPWESFVSIEKMDCKKTSSKEALSS